MLYFKIEHKIVSRTNSLHTRNDTIWRKFLNRLSRILSANPDFDDSLRYVAKWYIEYNEVYDVSWREIGFDTHGNVIIKMPDERNYGYWLDTNCTIEFFRNEPGFRFIPKQTFEALWNSVYYDRESRMFKSVNDKSYNG